MISSCVLVDITCRQALTNYEYVENGSRKASVRGELGVLPILNSSIAVFITSEALL